MSVAPDSHRNPRVFGIVRVSQVGGREGERFVSPEEQRARIEAACARDGMRLLTVREEPNVSGGKSLEGRPGLSAAVAAVESGQADVIAAAYFDRLFRSLATQAEVVERVERAGGQVLAVDVGQVTSASAGQWLSGTMMGAVSEYFRRSARERSAEGQARAVARGAIPWARNQVGYIRRDDGTFQLDPQTAPLARRAFEMRAEGASIKQIRAMLTEHGVKRSYRGIQVMLASRTYLGEVHFGELVNPEAHEPIVDRELWGRVQRMTVPRGPQARSSRLLSRLGVLRCGSCGARLSVMTVAKTNYPIYRCASTSDCDRHVTISARIAEDVITAAVRDALSDMEGRASAAENAQQAFRERDRAQAELDAAVRSFTTAGLDDEPAAVERLAQLRTARDDAQARLDQMAPQPELTINAADDWDKLSLSEQRALIRATVQSAVVAPVGRGAERITLRLYGQPAG
jgi:DNA invertase Pin-like site-specific DNA recombinase